MSKCPKCGNDVKEGQKFCMKCGTPLNIQPQKNVSEESSVVCPKCGKLDYITGSGRKFDTDFVMNNNFAFGGINTSLIFKKEQ